MKAPSVFLVFYLAMRGLLLLQPGYQDDLVAYRRWAVTAAREGLSHVYRGSDMDYPPLYAYLLLPLGKAYLALSPGAGTPVGGDPAVWTALAKLPPLLFDLAIGGLLFHVGARADAAPAAGPPAGLAWRWLLPGAYLANPAVVFDTGSWGQPDSIHSFFVLTALLLAAAGRASLGFASLALAILMKPLGAPFLPLLALLALVRSGIGGLLRGLLAGACVSLLVFLPFLLDGDVGFVVGRVALDLDAMPFTAVNAHNLWGALGGWRPAAAPVLGPLSPTQLGLALFLATYVFVLRRAWQAWAGGRAGDIGVAGILAAGVGSSFFMLSTHMHENHLFAAIPLLAMALPAGAAWRRLFAATSVAVLLNLALHDPLLPSRWPFTLGGPTGVARPSHGRSYFAGELFAVRAATGLTLAVYAALGWALYRRLPPLAPAGQSPHDEPGL